MKKILATGLLFCSCVNNGTAAPQGTMGGIWNVCTDADIAPFLQKATSKEFDNTSPEKIQDFLKCLRANKNKDENAVNGCAKDSGIFIPRDKGHKSLLSFPRGLEWAEAARTYAAAAQLSRCAFTGSPMLAFSNPGVGNAALAYYYIVPPGGKTDLKFSGDSLAFLVVEKANRAEAKCMGKHDLPNKPASGDEAQCYWFEMESGKLQK